MVSPDPIPASAVETFFEADGAGTTMTMRMHLPGAQARTATFEGSIALGTERRNDLLDCLFTPEAHDGPSRSAGPRARIPPGAVK